jgi:thioredoxin reductase (NADPH)
VSQDAGPRVLLIVDDEPDMLGILQHFAKACVPDVEVMTASSGTAALEKMQHRVPHAILSDYRMPDMDGAEFLNRSTVLAPDARRVLMTAYADSGLAHRAGQDVRLDAFVEKSRGAAAFAQVLKDVLR